VAPREVWGLKAGDGDSEPINLALPAWSLLLKAPHGLRAKNQFLWQQKCASLLS